MCDESTIVRLQFIGKILSLFTHQLNNHLAIIKDSLGFLTDLTELRGVGGEDATEILETVKALEGEINKATLLSKRLNSFGHRMDSEISTFDLNEVIEEMLTLVSKATVQKRLAFLREFGELPPINGNPSLFQFVLFCLLDRYIKALPPNGRLKVKTLTSEDVIRVLLEPMNELSSGPLPFCPDHIIGLGLKLLSCRISTEEPTGKTEIVLMK